MLQRIMNDENRKLELILQRSAKLINSRGLGMPSDLKRIQFLDGLNCKNQHPGSNQQMARNRLICSSIRIQMETNGNIVLR